MITFQNKEFKFDEKRVIQILEHHGLITDKSIDYNAFINDILDACVVNYTQVHDGSSNIGFNTGVSYNENGIRVIS